MERNMSDLISRQAAIDALTHKWDGMVTSVFDVLKELPSAEPERKTRRWITDGKHTDHNGIEWSMMHCSACGHKDIDSEVTRTPFCPWCGARMDGEQE